MKHILRFNKFIFTTFFVFLALAIFSSSHPSQQTGPKYFRAIASPFAPFTDPDNANFGLAWEVSKAALESQGYEVSVKFSSWSRALYEAKNGHFDGLLPAYWTEDREQWFLYPKPISSINTGLLKLRTRTDIKYDNDLTNLIGFRIGVGRGYSTSKEFDEAEYLDKLEVRTTPQILLMLWLGRIDLAVGGLEYSKHYLLDLDKDSRYKGIADDIVVIGAPLAKRAFYLVISKKTKNAKQKLSDLNKGLKKIIADGTYDRIISKYAL